MSDIHSLSRRIESFAPSNLVDEVKVIEQRITELEATIRRLCDIYVVDDYLSGEEREDQIKIAVERAIERTRGKLSEVNNVQSA